MVGEIVVTICQTPFAEMASDRGDFEALQRRVVELEARVAALELGGANGAQPAWDVPDGSPPDKLRSPDPAGSPDVLRELLGSPVPTEMWDADDWTAADTEAHPDWKLALLSPPGFPSPVLPLPESLRSPPGSSTPAVTVLFPEPSEVGELATGTSDREVVLGDGDEKNTPMSPPRAVLGAPAAPPKVEVAALVVGDSMARRATFTSQPPYQLTVAARGGLALSWGSGWIIDQVLAWAETARAAGQRLGPVIIWAGGNDVYPGPGGPARSPDSTAEDVEALLTALSRAVPEMIIVGPTPRPAFDEGQPWSATPAFQLERQLLRLATPGRGAEVLTLGRRVCRWRNGGRRLRGYYVFAGPFFAADGIHLAADGYERLGTRLPDWLGMAATGAY
ncbi:hypothetical protein FJT64_012286 [Amphibalanus amphitrite]|uniref:SGNH hydrolase-type esterase domain-containing protein n=1 Tax=Amphibalanus amphitrite TaxID=1232801 RepID=A0A6A4VD52_AMPAM|nr:hypothetical protein FJT64_012286 [Amphibalanus amphitrite]